MNDWPAWILIAAASLGLGFFLAEAIWGPIDHDDDDWE